MNRHVASHRPPGRSGPASPHPVNQHRSPSWASRKYRRCTSVSSGRHTRFRGVPARGLGAGILFLLMPGIAFAQSPGTRQPDVFHLEEATIEEIHHAIQDGQISCRRFVQAYVDRARTYNGICTQLVTSDGAPIAPASGPIRAGSALRFPTTTVPVSSVLPDSDQYGGIPLDLGRMEPAMSDPTVQAQFGMVVGIPNAGQVNALSTLNLRGERSVTCKGACDAHPTSGALPAGCPSACEAFRQHPDALERAAELDTQYGDNPDLVRLPTYCIPMAFKDVYDTKDMRTTTAADINFAMDAPPPTRPSSVDCGQREPLSTPRQTRPNSMEALGIPAGRPPRHPGTWGIRSGAPGPARAATPTIQSARREARVRDLACLSRPTSSHAPFANRRGALARGQPPETQWSAC